MSMPLGFATKVSIFSMRRRLVRTIISLIPCVLLIAIMVVGSTIPNGIVNELDKKVLQSAESRQELVTLPPQTFTQPKFSGGSGGPTFDFNQKLYDSATTAKQVEKVYPQYGLIAGRAAQIGNVPSPTITLNGASPELAKLYTGAPFAYTPGQPIPLLLSATNVYGMAYNWNGANTLELDYSDPKWLETKMQNHLLKDAEKLVGKTFELSFGGFPIFPEAFEQSTENSGAPKSKLTKLTDKDIKILERRVKELYGPYWDIAKLKEPLRYQFKVVGLIKEPGFSNTQSMIPNEAAVALWNNLYQKQIAARTSKVLDKEFLAEEQAKTEVKEGILQLSDSQMAFAQPSWPKNQNELTEDIQLQGLSVPGLLVETVKNKRNQNEYKELARTTITAANFHANSAVVQLKSPDDREAYIKYLTDQGVPYYDMSPLAAIRAIREGSQAFLTWLTLILGAVVALILLTTVSRFVADSRREIGVWRAIGATRLDISKLVLTRMLWLLVFGIGVGIVVGYSLSYFAAGHVAQTFNSAASGVNPYEQGFLEGMILSLLGGVVPKIDQTALLATDWSLLGSRLGLLTIITLIVGLFPAWRASRISPVTAIRDSE